MISRRYIPGIRETAINMIEPSRNTEKCLDNRFVPLLKESNAKPAQSFGLRRAPSPAGQGWGGGGGGGVKKHFPDISAERADMLEDTV